MRARHQQNGNAVHNRITLPTFPASCPARIKTQPSVTRGTNHHLQNLRDPLNVLHPASVTKAAWSN
jgi:hypothetical protein